MQFQTLSKFVKIIVPGQNQLPFYFPFHLRIIILLSRLLGQGQILKYSQSYICSILHILQLCIWNDIRKHNYLTLRIFIDPFYLIEKKDKLK